MKKLICVLLLVATPAMADCGKGDWRLEQARWGAFETARLMFFADCRDSVSAFNERMMREQNWDAVIMELRTICDPTLPNPYLIGESSDDAER